MNEEWIGAFDGAAKNAVEQMAFVSVTKGENGVKDGKLTFGEVTGLIGLAGASYTGCMVLSFEAPAILQIVSSMFGEEFTEVDDEVVEAVGELTNIISAGARKELHELGVELEMATPTLIRGKGVEISQFSTEKATVVPYSVDNGKFVVEFVIQPKN